MTPELMSQIQSVLTSICVVLVGLGAIASLLASVLPPSWRITQALARFAADLRGIRVPDPGRAAKKPDVALVEDPPKSGPSNPLPPAAALLLLGLVGFGSQACRATFDESRPKAALRGLSVAGVALLTPGSPECLSLSRQEHTWTGLAIAGGVLGTSGTVGALIDLGVRNEAKAEVYVMLAAGGLIDAAAAFAAQQAAGYGRDFVALGCSGTPAP